MIKRINKGIPINMIKSINRDSSSLICSVDDCEMINGRRGENIDGGTIRVEQIDSSNLLNELQSLQQMTNQRLKKE